MFVDRTKIWISVNMIEVDKDGKKKVYYKLTPKGQRLIDWLLGKRDSPVKRKGEK